MKILIADDEQSLVSFLYRGLRAEGYECEKVSELHSVVPNILQFQPQVLILDRLFGKQDSVSIMDSVRALPNSPMVLMLTALDEVAERVKGLDSGADDYLCKPFDFDELLSRISALRRRLGSSQTSEQEPQLQFEKLTLKLDQRLALVADEEVALTKIEFELLQFLLEHKEKVLSRERILNRVWQTHSDPHTNIVDVYISRLRKRTEGAGIIIQTMRGSGYRLSAETVIN